MDRPSSRLAVLTATVFLAIACSNAYADPPETSPEPGTVATEQGAPDDALSTSSGGGPADEGAAATGDELSGQASQSGAVSTEEVAPPQEPVQQLVSVTVGDPSAPSAAGGSEGGTAGPAAPGTTTTTAKPKLDETPAAAPEPPPAAASAVAQTTPATAPSTVPTPGTVAPVPPTSPTKAGPLAVGSSAPARPQSGDSLKQLLSDVGRELRSAQGQIDELRHGLDRGVAPPPSRLTRLRTTLVRIAPMLAALEVRLDAAGRLSPHLRQLLHGVRSDLDGVRATAGDLAVALRHSAAGGVELRLLLQELEAFRALRPTLVSAPATRTAPMPAVAGASVGYPQLQPAVQGSRLPAAPGTPRPRAGDPQAPRPHDGGILSADLMQWVSPLGSAMASPGGSFSFAAVAALTVLLIALTLPALLARLDLPAGRRYAVAFIAPLERPG